MYMPKLNQKGPPREAGVVQLAFLLILLAGIVASVYLVQNTQIFKPEAAPTLPAAEETSFELELESDINTTLFPDEPTPKALSLGTKFRVDVYARSDVDAANLFAAKIKYSTDSLEFVEVNRREGQSFVQNWVETSADNSNEGVISMIGGIPSPGIKTDLSSGAMLMGSIIFNTKKLGTAKIELTDTSAIYRNSDNLNILSARKGTIEVPIEGTASSSPISIQTDPEGGISCTNISVEGAVQSKLPTGDTIYLVESGGAVQLTASVTPVGTKLEWKEASRSQNLPEGRFEVTDLNSFLVTYVAPQNSASTESEEVTIGADVPNPDITQNPPTSCPGVTLAVKSTIQPFIESSQAVVPSNFKPSDLIGDGNGDGKLDLTDISTLLSFLNKQNAFPKSIDMNSDGKVNAVDFSLLRNLLVEKKVIKD